MECQDRFGNDRWRPGNDCRFCFSTEEGESSSEGITLAATVIGASTAASANGSPDSSHPSESKPQPKQEGRTRKYEKPANPNKRPPPEHRQPSGQRERNVGHPKSEEHSRRPKGGFRVRVPVPVICFICNMLESIEQPPPEPIDA